MHAYTRAVSGMHLPGRKMLNFKLSDIKSRAASGNQTAVCNSPKTLNASSMLYTISAMEVKVSGLQN